MSGTITHAQVGKPVNPQPFFIVNAILRAIESAEKLLGQPPTMVDIEAMFNEEASDFIKYRMAAGPSFKRKILDLFRND